MVGNEGEGGNELLYDSMKVDKPTWQATEAAASHTQFLMRVALRMRWQSHTVSGDEEEGGDESPAARCVPGRERELVHPDKPASPKQTGGSFHLRLRTFC